MTEVFVECGDGVGHLRLNRADALNALSVQFCQDIDASLLDLAAREDVHAILISTSLKHFCAGADIREMLGMTTEEAKASGFIGCVSAIPQLHKPVIVAVKGLAAGGGCELVLHSNAVQAHVESYPGLVEVGVGLIPGWGGCKEMIVRYMGGKTVKGGFINNLMATGGAMPVLTKVFEQIGTAKVAGSAEDARDMKILREDDAVTMNRVRVLADAKARCISLAQGYAAPEKAVVHLPGASARVAISMAVDGLAAAGKATPHDVVVSKVLAQVLSGGDTDISEPLAEQQILDLEHDAFLELIKTKGTLARIEHMLSTGKPLRN